MEAIRDPRLQRHIAATIARVVCSIVLLTTIGNAVHAEHGVPSSSEPYIFGFLPAYTPEKLVTTFEPLVEYLSQRLAVPIKFETAPDFREFVRRTQNGNRYDFLFTAPHLFFLAQQRAGYHLVAQVDGGDLRAVIVVRADEPWTDASHLRGKQIASIEPIAIMSVLARSKLSALGLNSGSDFEIVTTPSHDASLQALVRYRSDAAVLPSPYWSKRIPPHLREKLRVLVETESIPHIPISAAPWVPEAVVSHMRQILIEMAQTPDGAMILKRIGWQGFVPAISADFDAMEPLSKYVDL